VVDIRRIPVTVSNTMTNLSPQQLRKAADLKEKIEALQKQLDALLGGGSPAAPAVRASGRRKMSAAGRAAIAAAARARWAKERAKKGSAPAKPKKRKVSAAGRAALAAAARARWAKAKAAGRSKL